MYICIEFCTGRQGEFRINDLSFKGGGDKLSSFLLHGKSMNKKEIEKLAEDVLIDDSYFVVEVTVSNSNVIEVFVDADKEVTIADCTKMSREMESRLDRDQEDFQLSVSSAGFTKPFKVYRQYHKNIGRAMDVMTRDSSRKTGTLLDATEGEGITLRVEDFKKNNKKKKKSEEPVEVFIPFEEITIAKGLVTF